LDVYEISYHEISCLVYGHPMCHRKWISLKSK
jgi:hypothetical protein